MSVLWKLTFVVSLLMASEQARGQWRSSDCLVTLGAWHFS